MAPLCYPKNQPFWDAPQGAQPHPSPKPCKAQWSMVQKPAYKLLHPANGNWAKWWCPPSSDQSRAIEAEVGQFILNNFDSRCVFPIFIAVYNNVCISHMFITFILKNEHNIIIFILGICRERERFLQLYIFLILHYTPGNGNAKLCFDPRQAHILGMLWPYSGDCPFTKYQCFTTDFDPLYNLLPLQLFTFADANGEWKDVPAAKTDVKHQILRSFYKWYVAVPWYTNGMWLFTMLCKKRRCFNDGLFSQCYITAFTFTGVFFNNIFLIIYWMFCSGWKTIARNEPCKSRDISRHNYRTLARRPWWGERWMDASCGVLKTRRWRWSHEDGDILSKKAQHVC